MKKIKSIGKSGVVSVSQLAYFFILEYKKFHRNKKGLKYNIQKTLKKYKIKDVDLDVYRYMYEDSFDIYQVLGKAENI